MAAATGAEVTSVPKVVDLETLIEIRRRARVDGKVVAWTNGCFDLLHVGHVRSLQAARRLADLLIVGLNSDESVCRLKGPGRPIVPAVERAELLSALECVDYVVVFDEATPEELLSRLRPDIHCKGAEYQPPYGKPIAEASLIQSYGGQIKFLPMVPASSTSDIVRRIRDRSA